VLGKKVSYPGWDTDEFFQTVKSNENASIKYCIAPDHLYKCIKSEIVRATNTISMEMYTLDQAWLIDLMTQRLDAGVRISVLLDGSAIEAQGKWGCSQIEAHGGECWILASKPQANVHKRYDNQHGKWFVVDRTRAAIGSENLGDDAMPADDKTNGTLGTRGGFLITDNPTIVSAAQKIIEHDFAPAHHADVRRWGTNTDDFPP
jgi:phosphatidylserine/phosphatidylglycerophosphate/cardiolipin synthase-like enzyme